MFPALASLCKRLAGSLGDQDMVDQDMGGAPPAMAGAMGCPMVVGTVEDSTSLLLSVVRASSTHSFFLVSLEVITWMSLCQQELVAMSTLPTG